MTPRPKFTYPVIALSEPDVLLRQFITAATNAVKGDKPAAIMVQPETLKVLLSAISNDQRG